MEYPGSKSIYILKNTFLFFLVLLANFTYGQSAEAYYNNAIDFLKKGDNQSALIKIKQAIYIDSTNTRYLEKEAQIFYNLEMYLEAYDSYSKAILLEPQKAFHYINRAFFLNSIRKFDAAIDDYSVALDLLPPDTSKNFLLLNRAISKINKRDFNEGYLDLMMVYNNDSSDIAMLTTLASICDEVGKGEEVLPYLLKVIKLNPDYFPAYGNIGFKYQEMGDYKKAIEYFTKVLEIEPNEPLGYSNRSFNKLKLGDIQGAYSDIENSIRLYPANSYAYRIRALIYIQDNKIESACKDLSIAIDLGFSTIYGDEVINLQKKYCPK